MENYKEIIKERLSTYWDKHDDINIIGYFREAGNKCELCGYYPIKNNFILKNSRTKELLIVGSNCVYNFKQAIRELGKEVFIVSSNIEIANYINKYHPDTVKIIPPNDEYDKEVENDIACFRERTDFHFSEFNQTKWLSIDELAPEGMGLDDFNWDAHDFDPPER